MAKKNDKRLCWNCEGDVPQHLQQCTYCGAEITKPAPVSHEVTNQEIGSPFQTGPRGQAYAAFSDSLYPSSDEENSFFGQLDPSQESYQGEAAPHGGTYPAQQGVFAQGETPPADKKAPPLGAPPFSQPPFTSSQMNVSEEEWNQAMEEEGAQEQEDTARTTRREIIALLLLLPGVVFFLFGLALTLFCTDGVLTLKWNQNLAYFYFLGSIPLIYLGWAALKK